MAAESNPKCCALTHGFVMTEYNSDDLSTLLETMRRSITDHEYVTRVGLTDIMTNVQQNATAVQYVAVLDKQRCIKTPLTVIRSIITAWAAQYHISLIHDAMSDLPVLGVGKKEAIESLNKGMCQPIFTADKVRSDNMSAQGSSTASASPHVDISSSEYEQSMLPWHGYLLMTCYRREATVEYAHWADPTSKNTYTYEGTFPPVQDMCTALSKAIKLLGSVKEVVTVAYVYNNDREVLSNEVTTVTFTSFVKTHKVATKKTCDAFIRDFNAVKPTQGSRVTSNELKPGSSLEIVTPDGVLTPWPLVGNIMIPYHVLKYRNPFHVTNTKLHEWMMEKRAQLGVVNALTVYGSNTSTLSDDGAQACMVLATVRKTSTAQVLLDIEQDMKVIQNSHSDMLTQYTELRKQTLKDTEDAKRSVEELQAIYNKEVKKRDTYTSQIADEKQELAALSNDLKKVRSERDAKRQEDIQSAVVEKRRLAELAQYQALAGEIQKQTKVLATLKATIAREESRGGLKRKFESDDTQLIAREREVMRREHNLLQREKQEKEIARQRVDSLDIRSEVSTLLNDCISHVEGAQYCFLE